MDTCQDIRHFHRGQRHERLEAYSQAHDYIRQRFDSGQYQFLGWTYGYIQDKDYTVYANKGQIADMKINLIIGVNMTLDILFKKEDIIS